MNNPAVFHATFSENNALTVNLFENTMFDASFEEVFIAHDTPVFEGEYEYTPGTSAQIIPISGMAAAQDIIINPIPSNYGLISWNGSILTVS